MGKRKPSPVDKLGDSQVLLLKETFQDFDAEGEGEIGTDDLGAVMKTLGMECTESELQAMIDDVDADGSGTIDFPEFLLMMCDKMAPSSELTIEEETVQALAALDSAAEGVLDKKQLAEVFMTMGNKMTKQEAYELIDVVGLDDHGKVDYEALVRKIHEAAPGTELIGESEANAE